MIDVNLEAEKTLSKLDCNVTYYYPKTFNNLPIISYYSLGEKGAFSYDNQESIQKGTIQVDIWSAKALECGNISIMVNDVMTNDGWHRELSKDVPNPDSRIYHKTMRFSKNFQL